MSEKKDGEGETHGKTPTGFIISSRKDVFGKDVEFVKLKDGKEVFLDPWVIITGWNYYGRDPKVSEVISYLPGCGYAQTLACLADVARLIKDEKSVPIWQRMEKYDNGPAVRIFWRRNGLRGTDYELQSVYQLYDGKIKVTKLGEALGWAIGAPAMLEINKILRNKNPYKIVEVEFPISSRDIHGYIRTKQWGKLAPGFNYKFDIDTEGSEQLRDYIKDVVDDISGKE